MTKSIAFLLPGFSTIPMGGFKVVYEYANRLAGDGYDVSLYFPATILANEKGMIYRVRQFCSMMYRKLTKSYLPVKWFKLDARIKTYCVYSLSYDNVGYHDCIIATAAETSEYLSNYPQKINKAYMIQGKEDWNIDEKRLSRTYGLGLKNIVISNWLKKYVESFGYTCSLIPNGFDFNYFKCSKSITERSPYVISMMYHVDERKDVNTALMAIKSLKEKYPQIKIKMFGAYKKPDDLPDWIDYTQKPNRISHNEIYNDSSIYVSSSRTEGWGLTVGEAMICGCAVACTNTLGFLEMVTDNETGLVSPIGDSKALSLNIEKLISDNELRYRIATAGNKSIKNFSWEKSYKKLKNILELE